MGLFSAKPSRWPEVPWRGCAWHPHHHRRTTSDHPSRPTPLRPLSQARAIDYLFLDRASESIQRISLVRNGSRAGTAFRRWMLPTVERGPPATILRLKSVSAGPGITHMAMEW
jgi:hypothetical protein